MLPVVEKGGVAILTWHNLLTRLKAIYNIFYLTVLPCVS